jgi:hypothetical protein
MPNSKPLTAAARKRKQRLKIEAYCLKKTGGKIRTAEGYVMYLIAKEKSS